MATFSLKTKKYLLDNEPDNTYNTSDEIFCEQEILDKKSSSNVTFGHETTSNNSVDADKISIHSNAAIIERSAVPDSHRRIADNYMIIKKIFKFSVVQSVISDYEKDLLKKCNLPFLNDCTVLQINNEIFLLKEWGESSDKNLQELSAYVLEIRVKELKHLLANYSSSNIFEGTRILEKYLENISKYKIE